MEWCSVEIEVLYYSDQQVHIIVDKHYNHFNISYIYVIINVVKRRAFCEKLTYTFDTMEEIFMEIEVELKVEVE